MSRRKFRLTAPKNWERKKYAKPESLLVSIPLGLLQPTTLNELCTVALPSKWSFIPFGEDSTLRLCKMDPTSFDHPVKVFMTIEVRATLEWIMFI